MNLYTTSPRTSSRAEVPPSSRDCPPPDFNAVACPIIARHFFGVEPFHPIAQIAAEVIAGLKRQWQIEHLHSLGPRPVLEALIEIAAGGELDTVLADYARLDREVVVALGGDLFPPSIFAVGAT